MGLEQVTRISQMNGRTTYVSSGSYTRQAELTGKQENDRGDNR
jgi:hypothetical protein